MVGAVIVWAVLRGREHEEYLLTTPLDGPG